MAVKTAPPPRHVQSHFLNRELGLLEFQRRVLAQAEDPEVPLLERLKFLCIVSSNLDEFFEIRVSGVKEQIKMGIPGAGPDGKTPREVFQAVSRITHELVARQYRLLNDSILPDLEREGIKFLRRSEFTAAQTEWVRGYFLREMAPVLTPIGLDPAHPFPRVFNKSLNFAVELEGRDAFGRDARVAIVQAPRILPRIIKLPPELSSGHRTTFVFLTSILHEHVQELFAGMTVLGCYQFRVTRNSDLFVDEEDVKDLRRALQGELPQRHFGDAVRLEIADDCPLQMTEFLLQQFGLGADDLYQVNGPVNLVRLMAVPDEVDREDLAYRPFRPGFPAELATRVNMAEAIRAGDILLHHPYQSFAPVVRFLQEAAATRTSSRSSRPSTGPAPTRR
jgi:polyphosphate kinase